MNKSGNENRSVRNTKRKLKEALMTLMQTKPVNAISVKELTELADVNRGTFYLHYSDIYDMLHKIEDDFFVEFEGVLNNSTPSDENDAIMYMKEIYTFLKKNEDICRMFCSSNVEISFFNKLKLLIGNKCCSVWESAELQMNRKQTEYYNAFIFSGSAGILQHWLDNDLAESPEDVARLVAAIIANSAKSFLVVSDDIRSEPVS